MAAQLIRLIRRCKDQIIVLFLLFVYILYELSTLQSLFKTQISDREITGKAASLSFPFKPNERLHERLTDVLTESEFNLLQKPPPNFTFTIDQKDLCRNFHLRLETEITEKEFLKREKLEQKDGREEHPLALVIVLSRMKNFKQRQLIRSTWGNRNLLSAIKMALMFVVGREKTAQAFIQKESDRYWDIVQINILESYKNLVFKSLAALEWAGRFCSGATWVFKTDDDAFVNIFALRNYFRDLVSTENSVLSSSNKMSRLAYPTDNKNSVLCERVNKGIATMVLRKGPKGVSYTEYNKTHFPEYCMGLGYGFLISVVPAILYQARKPDGPNILRVEDVFLTGIIANRYLHLSLHDIHNSTYRSHPGMPRDSIVEKFMNGERFVLERSAELNHLDSVDLWKIWYYLKERNR